MVVDIEREDDWVESHFRLHVKRRRITVYEPAIETPHSAVGQFPHAVQCGQSPCLQTDIIVVILIVTTQNSRDSWKGLFRRRYANNLRNTHATQLFHNQQKPPDLLLPEVDGYKTSANLC